MLVRAFPQNDNNASNSILIHANDEKEYIKTNVLRVSALKKLRNLNLSYNLLTSIGDERFTFIDHDYTNVLEIDLSNNKIESLR